MVLQICALHGHTAYRNYGGCRCARVNSFRRMVIFIRALAIGILAPIQRAHG